MVLGVSRGMYALASRNEGPKPKVFAEIDKHTGMPSNSAVFGLFMSMAWLVYFYGANLADGGWFGKFNFDSSELPVVTIYAMYIPMMIMWMKKEKDLGVFKRFILPIAAMLACAFMVFAALYAHGFAPYMKAAESGEFSFPVLFYFIVFAVIMIIGFFFSDAFKKKSGKNKKN